MTQLARKLVFVFLFLSTPAFAENHDLAFRLFDRLAGTPLALRDPRLPQIESLLSQGKAADAAHIATDDDGFFNLTLRHWASTLSNRSEYAWVPLNDFIALVIGVARDGVDARELLTGNYLYYAPSVQNVPFYEEANNLHFEGLDARNSNLRQKLVKQSPQHQDIPDAAGLLTTRAWGAAHLKDGTNRRALAFAFREFLCTPIEKLSDTSVSDERVRRDVTRAPGGKPQTYLSLCSGCHGGMDALVGAYNHFDFVDGSLIYAKDQPVAKTNKNAHVFPSGYTSFDDNWFNEWNVNQNASLGWGDVPQKGYGIHSLGVMLANSAAYGSCLAKRVYSQICKRDLELAHPVIQKLSASFKSGGYNLRKLFEQVAVEPSCLGIP